MLLEGIKEGDISLLINDIERRNISYNKRYLKFYINFVNYLKTCDFSKEILVEKHHILPLLVRKPTDIWLTGLITNLDF